MADRREQLIQCFSAVFPGLSRDEIVRASTSSLPRWDSIAMINLVSVIEEEMKTSVEPEDLERFVSFEMILDVLGE
jgi:acyl carrier protein